MDAQKAKQTLLDIKKVLNKARVKFWLVDGVALGAVRDGAFIPYDADMDIRVMAKGFDVPVMIDAFKEAGFAVRKSHNPKLYGNLLSGIIITKRGIKTDMCFGYLYPPDDTIVVLAGRPVEGISVLSAHLFKGAHYITFLGTKFRVPYPAPEYLTLHYGKNWTVPVNAKYPHLPLSIVEEVAFFHKYPEVNGV